MNAEVSAESVELTDRQVATSSNDHNEKSEEELFYHPERSICVCPLPKTISREELVYFLHQFGPVKRERFRRKSFIIEYYNSKTVEVLMSKSHWLHREKLCLQRKVDCEGGPKNKNKQAQMAAENADPISYSRIRHVIKDEVTFDRELAALLNEIQLSDAELMGRYKVICPHLNDIFRSTYPECQAFSFGSTVAGLSFKECDLDIYMYLGTVGVPPFFSQPNVPQQVITAMIFKKVRKIMYSMKFIFTDIIAIPKAKTPIIKFRYLPTNVSCDISFKNGLGVYKSYFLKYCASRNVRLKSVMLLIKYWAKHFGISGSGRISNYGLTCLVIFYLQHINLLPSLLELQKNCVPLIINGWQVNFNENAPFCYRNVDSPYRSDRIESVFYDFVHFCAVFNFRLHVLCLLDGQIYRVVDFMNLSNLPDYMHRYKNFVMENNKKLDMGRAMCVQDPFELDQNTTAITSERVLKAFQSCCSFTANICESAREQNYDNLLKMLFDTTLPSMLQPKKKRKSYKIVISAGRFIKAGLPEDFEQETNIMLKEERMKKNWFYVVFNLIRDIFEMVFKLNVEVILDHKRNMFLPESVELLSRRHTDFSDKIVFHCTGNKCVWKNRKKNNRTFLDVQLSALEKEAIVSDRVLEQLDKQNDKDATDIQLKFSCTLEKARSVSLIMTLNDESYNRGVFRQFECFADSIISKIIEKTLLHMLQFNKSYSQLLQTRQS